MTKYIVLFAALSCALVGCTGSDTGVSKAEEEAFRNPPKEIPPEALKAMQKAREDSARMASEAMKKSPAGNQSTGGN